MTQQLAIPFTYDTIEPDARYRLQQRAIRIDAREARIVQDIIDNGRDFAEARDELRHNKAGGFRGWIEHHGWSYRTAYRYIRVFEEFGNCDIVAQLTPKVLYLMTESDTSDMARDEILKRADAGETVTPSQAQQIIDQIREYANNGSVREMTAAVIIEEIKQRPLEAMQVVQKAVEALDGIALHPIETHDDDQEDELDPPMELEEVADLFPEELTPTDKELIKTTTPAPRVNAGLYSSATPEWYTPRHIVDAVAAMFSTIDLDPCSNSSDWREASVPAETYYTKDDDGLSQPWHGKVYMNPPYGDEIAAWVERLRNAYAEGEITEAIALLPARTDTAWFQPLIEFPICWVRGRLKFSGSINSAPFPSAIIYLGLDAESFTKHFAPFGKIK